MLWGASILSWVNVAAIVGLAALSWLRGGERWVWDRHETEERLDGELKQFRRELDAQRAAIDRILAKQSDFWSEQQVFVNRVEIKIAEAAKDHERFRFEIDQLNRFISRWTGAK